MYSDTAVQLLVAITKSMAKLHESYKAKESLIYYYHSVKGTLCVFNLLYCPVYLADC